MIFTPFPCLYGKDSKGGYKQWHIKALVTEDNEAFTETRHGKVNGKIQVTRKAIKGKNLGRANETTPYEQAVKEAESTWKKKFKKNYRETYEELETDLYLLPMLAHKFLDRQSAVRWPAFAQPKLNGVRCIAERISDTEVKYTSREANEFLTFGHLTPYICNMIPVGAKLDGEMFNPNLTFEEIMSRVKRVLGDRSDIKHDPIQYWIYDALLPKEPFKTRFDALKDYFSDVIDHYKTVELPLVFTETVLVQNAEEFEKWHSNWAAKGFEGAMLRNLEGPYLLDYRSTDLLKYKHFVDEDFVIVGGHEGEGKDAGTVIFECITQDGKPFSARPKGSYEIRKHWWDTLETQKGKNLTVRYQNYSAVGIPIFPVGLMVRDYE